MPALETINVGDTATCQFEVSESAVNAFAALSHDDNPLHMQNDFAKARGFPGRVAHGMLALSMISKLIGTQLPGPGALWMSQELQFTAPVYVGDLLEAKVTVQSISLAARIVALQTEVLHSITKAVVLRGVAKVRVPAEQPQT